MAVLPGDMVTNAKNWLSGVANNGICVGKG